LSRSHPLASCYYCPLIPKGLSKTFSKPLACAVHRLDKTIDRGFKVCLLAPRATARSGEAFSLFKHIPARHTAEREHHKLPFLGYCRKSDVGQMLVDLLFSNANGLGDFSGSHLLLVQEEEDFLANGLRMALLSHVSLRGASLPAYASLNL